MKNKSKVSKIFHLYNNMKSIAFLFLLVPSFGWSQNLVPNPSFEEYEECPTSLAELDVQTDWISWNESPDYYNTCNNAITGWVGVPSNLLGNQVAITGAAYSGFVSYASNDSNIREYMAIQLLTPLDLGEHYYVMFYANQAEGETGTIPMEYRCATNHIGLRFFKNPDYDNSSNPLEPDNFAHVDYSDLLSDTSHWVRIEGWFTADDSYNWIAIGNFFDDTQTTVLVQNETGEYNVGYYFIENICISTDSLDCQYLLHNQETGLGETIRVFPNPVEEQLMLEFSAIDVTEISISNNLGQCVLKQKINTQREMIDVSKFSPGMYHISCKRDDFILIHKFIKQ
jgi:hypothetical protein